MEFDNDKKKKKPSNIFTAKQCKEYLAVNAQKGFDSNLLTVNMDKNEIKFKNGTRILFFIIDEDDDLIEWVLLDRSGNEIKLPKNLKDAIENELLDLLIDECPAEYREDDEIRPGHEIGKETKNKREENKETDMIKESKTTDIVERNPKIVDSLVDELMSQPSDVNWDRLFRNIEEDLAYKLDQAGLMSPAAQRKTAHEFLAKATITAKEQGYEGPVLSTETENKENANSDIDRIYEENNLVEFLDYLKNTKMYDGESVFDYVAGRLYRPKNPNYRRSGKAQALDTLYSYYKEWKGIRSTGWRSDEKIPSEIKSQLTALLKHDAKEFKESYKSQQESKNMEQQEKTETLNEIRKQFFSFYNRIDGNKLFLREFNEDNDDVAGFGNEEEFEDSDEEAKQYFIEHYYDWGMHEGSSDIEDDNENDEDVEEETGDENWTYHVLYTPDHEDFRGEIKYEKTDDPSISGSFTASMSDVDEAGEEFRRSMENPPYGGLNGSKDDFHDPYSDDED